MIYFGQNDDNMSNQWDKISNHMLALHTMGCMGWGVGQGFVETKAYNGRGWGEKGGSASSS